MMRANIVPWPLGCFTVPAQDEGSEHGHHDGGHVVHFHAGIGGQGNHAGVHALRQLKDSSSQ